MIESSTFTPPQRFGTLFQMLLIGVFLTAAALGLWQAVYTSIGPMLILYLFPAFLAVFLVPLLAYRIYGLRTAVYSLEREGIHLRWGLRVEDIPIDHILWIHKKEELESHLHLPWFHWPGSLLGTRRAEGMEEVEFMASRTQGLILIGTPEQIFAISPANPDLFLHTVSQIMEMGSLAPIPGRSIYPTNLMSRVWTSRLARWMLIGCILFSLLLLIWVSIAIPSRSQVILGFEPNSSPGDMVPASRLLLLPILSTSFVLINFFLGLFLYRKDKNQPLSLLLWGSSTLLPLIFLIGVIFIMVNSPG
jgi:hypothetical protein